MAEACFYGKVESRESGREKHFGVLPGGHRLPARVSHATADYFRAAELELEPLWLDF